VSSINFQKPPLYQHEMHLNGEAIWDIGSFSDCPPPEKIKVDSGLPGLEEIYCPFCRFNLETLKYREIKGMDYDDFYLEFRQEVRGCLHCGWWNYECLRATESAEIKEFAKGCILRPEDASIWAPVPIIREHLNNHPEYLKKDINPIVLEQLLRDVFSDYYNCEVKWTGRGPDGGFDLFHVLADTGAALYQIKRRGLSAKSESVIPLRSLVGAMIEKEVTTGIFVTTSDNFSNPAETYASNINERGYKLELIDYSILIDILKNTLPKVFAPWRNIWNEHSSIHKNYKQRIKTREF
jgi:hypothetical protein